MSAGGVQEYTVRVPRHSSKQHCVMQFNNSLAVDFTKWSHVKMVREVPVKETVEDDTPKFGADSEFGKEARQEARRRRFGYNAKKHCAENYPWLMKVGGRMGRRYRGVRGGGITENTAYYVFTQAKDGAFEAFPVAEWYNFQHVQRYKALSAEEAEEEFSKRDKIMNYFSVMVKKRLKNDEDVEVDGEKSEDKKSSKSKELKISDMDEWPGSSDDSGSSNEDEDNKEENKKKKKNAEKDKKKRKNRKSNVKEEAFEDSDDGDEEGREMDYISDSSESDEEVKVEKEEKGVDQEDALKRLLDSDAEVEESSEEEKDKEQKEDSDNKNEEEENSPQKKKKKKSKKVRKEDDSSGDSDSADSASIDRTELPVAKTSSTSAVKEEVSAQTKAERIVGDMKRKTEERGFNSAAKRAKLESAAAAQLSNDTGITEDAVRRYLARKPMTTTELLQKFKSKKVGLSSDQLVPVIAQILKRINPTKHTVKGKMYLSVKK